MASLKNIIEYLKAELMPNEAFPYEQLYHALFEADMAMGIPPDTTVEEQWQKYVEENGTLEEFTQRMKEMMEARESYKIGLPERPIPQKEIAPQIAIDGIERLEDRIEVTIIDDGEPKRRKRE